MDIDLKARHDLWRWSMENVRPGTYWRFAGPGPEDGAVILAVLDLHWRTPEKHYEAEFSGILVEDRSGRVEDSLPDGSAPLPEWFKKFQQDTGNTLYFMVMTTFKEQVDAGRITPAEVPDTR